MNLSSLKPAPGSTGTNRRLGRGEGSGMGGTSTRGNKGAQSRSGYSQKPHFEGGQMPIQRRVPKFGFRNINRIEYRPINLDSIQELIEKTGTTVVNMALLIENGIAHKLDLVKVLSRGEITSAVEVTLHGFSKSAAESIEKVGGKAIKL